VNKRSGLSHGVNKRTPSAVMSECTVLETVKLKTSKIADTSCRHFDFL